jgi:AdoMet-dependent heme synthase
LIPFAPAGGIPVAFYGMTSRLRFDQAPRRVYWEVTRACDLACHHCRAAAATAPDPAELTPKEGLGLIDRLAAFGVPVPHLVLTGGDPLRRPDLFTLIAGARARGFDVSVAPSATPLLTPRVIARLRAAGVDAISLSLDGSDAERHDAIRRISGCFDRTITAARACVVERLPFQINTLVSEETLGDLAAIDDLATALGAARWSLFFLIGVGRGALLRPITARACEELFERLRDRAARPGPIVTTTEAPHFRRVLGKRAGGHGAGIRDGNGIMFISDAGEVRPSGFFAVAAGDVRTGDPVEIYRDSDLFRSLRRPDLFCGRCGRCEWREVCGGSRARALAAGDALGEDPLCLYEPAAAVGSAL